MQEYSAGLVSGVASTPLMRYIVKQGMGHSIASLVRKNKGRKLSRSQRKKIINKSRRWFTDNIIMHHKRLHKKNHELILEQPKQVIKRKKLKRKKEKEKEAKKSNDDKIWKNPDQLKHRGAIIRGRIDARRLKSRSRWLSVA